MTSSTPNHDPRQAGPEPYAQQPPHGQQPQDAQPGPYGQPGMQGYPAMQGMPPAPAPKKRNWFMRHKILTAILAILALIVVGSALGGGKRDQPPAAGGSAPAATSAPAEQQSGSGGQQEQGQPQSQPSSASLPGIGTAVSSGDLSFTVTKVETGVASVGSSSIGHSAQGQYVLVHVSVANTGKKSETLSASQQLLVDTQGRQHETDSTASMYLGEDSLIFEEINPGNTATGILIYDIPADAVVDKAIFQAGLFGGKAEVSLAS